MTADRLLYVELQFNAERYDLKEDIAKQASVTSTIKAAWTRRLADAAKLSIGRCDKRLPADGPRDSFPIADVRLAFTDGETVDLRIDQFALNTDEDRSVKFVAVVRAGAGL